MTKDATIYGMSLFNAGKDRLDEIHKAIAGGLSAGILRPPVGRSFPLAEASASHHEIINSKANGKIVLLP